MSSDTDKAKELDLVLTKFSSFIKFNITKFNLPKTGIDPDDVLQEIRIKIWKILNDEKKILNYSSYIKKIVDSSVIDHLRKMRREKGYIALEKHHMISEWNKNYEIEHQRQDHVKEMIAQAVDSLLDSRRKVVKLFLLNMTIDEISIMYSWSKDKTRNLLYRGLSDLKKILKEKGIEYENK